MNNKTYIVTTNIRSMLGKKMHCQSDKETKSIVRKDKGKCYRKVDTVL